MLINVALRTWRTLRDMGPRRSLHVVGCSGCENRLLVARWQNDVGVEAAPRVWPHVIAC